MQFRAIPAPLPSPLQLSRFSLRGTSTWQQPQRAPSLSDRPGDFLSAAGKDNGFEEGSVKQRC